MTNRLLEDDEVKQKVLELFATMSKTEIAEQVGVDRRRIGEFLRKRTYPEWWESKGAEDVPQSIDTTPSKVFTKKGVVGVLGIQTSKYAPSGGTHVMIPDTQVKPNIDMSWLDWVGEFLASKKPDVIIHIGDHFDLPSLSSYDKGTKKAEGKHLHDDIQAGIEGMNRLLKPIYDLQQKELQEFGEVRYKPKMVFTLGNHEQRLERHINANPELTDLVSYSDFRLEEFGWEVYDFLEPAIVNGVMYIHYLPNPMTGRPYGGSALNVLNKIGCSASMGHVQKLDIATKNVANGQAQWLIVCGACYPHKEGYKGYIGNHHFRGLVVKHGVDKGNYNPMIVDLDYLERKYAN